MILIDDCSTDRSKEIIKENIATNMTLIELTTHSGTAIARNKGIEKARGRYIRILTIAVIIDLNKIPKEECYMTNVMNEDIATWWRILKKGYTAYGLNEVLVYYRRYKNSKTSSKLKNAKYRWELYRKVEKLPFLQAIYYFIFYAFYGIIKRI